MAKYDDEFKPGDKVLWSGIYKVTHDSHHPTHEVTCVAHHHFPPCSGCRHPRFVLAHKAVHVTAHESFTG